MKQPKIWFLTCLFSISLLFAVAFAPNIFAQTNTQPRESAFYLQKFQSLYEFLQMYYVDPVEAETLYQGAVEGMLNALKDPYTMLIDNTSLTGVDLHDTTTGFFGGIGVSFVKPLVSTPEKPAYVEVSSPIEDTPSWKAGIQSGDLITAIENESTIKMTHSDVVSKLRGKIGTPVTLTIQRGKTLEFPLTLTRAKIEVPTIKYEMLDNKIGYIRLIDFNPNASRRIREAMESMQQKGADKLILDLRNNPGGLISAAVDTASLFIENGTIVSTKSRIPQQNIVFEKNPKIPAVFKDMPLVVLINKGSASASEILAGVLKDYKRAYLVGETTFGKGSVQQILDLTQNSSFKVTVARYYVPSDVNIDKTGIKPDRTVLLYPPFTPEDEKKLEKLFKDAKIPTFIKEHATLSSQEITAYAEKLAAEYQLNKEVLRLLIRQEYNNKHTTPITDIAYDQQLQAAVTILTKENLADLLQKTTTVREDKEAAEAKSLAEKEAS
ncbi:MAG: S41 family peptidase [Treponema sp.]